VLSERPTGRLGLRLKKVVIWHKRDRALLSLAQNDASQSIPSAACGWNIFEI
jgi:hypothetical protein